MNLDPREIELRQKTYAWIEQSFQADTAKYQLQQEHLAARIEQAPEALALVEKLRVNGDASAFRYDLDRLTSRKDSHLALAGPNGQMVLNQIINYSPDKAAVAALLGDVLQPPESDDAARQAIERLVDHCVAVRKGTAPQSGRVAPLLSAFWMLADPDRWPSRWSSAATSFERLGWSVSSDPAGGYLEFVEMVRLLGAPTEVLNTFWWFGSEPWLGPDPTIADRTKWGWEMKEAELDTEQVAFVNVDAMLGPLRQAGDALGPAVGAALDREVSKRLPPRVRTTDLARYDAHVNWFPKVVGEGWHISPGLRLWFGLDGVMIGLHPGYREQGWVAHAKEQLAGRVPASLEIIDYYRLFESAAPKPDQNDFLVGRFYTYEDFDWASGRDEVVNVAEAALPVLQTLLSDGPGWGAAAPLERSRPEITDELAALFREFVAKTGYPDTDDLEQQDARDDLAARLTAAALPSIDVTTFRQVIGSHRYGYAGNRSVLYTTLADPDEDAVQDLVVTVLADLLYGPGAASARIDRATAGLKGLGQAGAMKLLAIAEPDTFLPIFPLTGPSGKLALLPLLGITDLPTGTPGERAVKANDLIRDRLGSIPELADDPWGQMCFAYWLRDRTTDVVDDSQGFDARLAAATDACTLPPDSVFLADLYKLLKEKGQIVLYGPPGTGKTWLALELAQAIAPDPERQALVQFHPSMAYEDFMEGFRPVLRGGNLTYELSEGPLIELANKAAVDGRDHVLIIDEMNRANLPKVFGELLFLLEYRNRPVKLAYRASDDAFALPDNLLIIGTMNLADRSVGQIDAALRRRFAFVPFTPGDEQNGGLLRRWLSKLDLPTWPADIVDEVNAELESDLGHADLLIGPSYFMKETLDDEQMASIWRYAIEPLMSDLFHGDDGLVKKYTWVAVTKRFAALLPDGNGDSEPSEVSESDAVD